MTTAMQQIAGLTEKQGAILEALGAMEADALGPDFSVRDITRSIAEDGQRVGWVGTDPEGMRMTLRTLVLRGYVGRREYERVRNRDFRWRWYITGRGWDALMRFYDEKGL